MAFDFDIEHIKGNAIPHVDALSRLCFWLWSKENTTENSKNIFLTLPHVKKITDILFVDQSASKSLHYLVMNRIVLRIRNVCNNYSKAKNLIKKLNIN